MANRLRQAQTDIHSFNFKKRENFANFAVIN